MDNLIYNELLNIAVDEGIEIVHKTFRSVGMSGLYVQNGDIKVIFLDEKLSKDIKKKNFVIAHEIGHHKLHQGQINEKLYFNDVDYRDKFELEADNYAGELINKITAKLSHTKGQGGLFKVLRS